MVTKTGLPISGAISKGYNFASTWEQNAPLSDQQQAAIAMLSHAVADRPFPANLVGFLAVAVNLNLFFTLKDSRRNWSKFQSEFILELVQLQSQDNAPRPVNGLSVSTEDATRNSGAIEQALVNTNQFYKWFTDLEAAMKSETEEKYQHYVNTLTDRIQTCDDILRQVDETLKLFNELQLQH